MRAILIDTPARTIREVETDGALPDLYALIVCRYIEAYRWPSEPDHWFICDEEGALKTPPLPRFVISGFPAVLHGRALIVQANSQGDHISASLPLSEVTEAVRFI